ncbi:MAG: hypothetical protein ABR79_05875 [Cryomorphaceae bacterium BACL11 MAG-121001-bin54]|nr:MAG: hypothetical protein ABR79_05875 [Cryomorphaceae bacterium BACL11 MAG-121001-bin54]
MNKQRLEQKQYQSLSPQQIQFLGLLQIPIVSLEKRIEQELEENPALDEDEQEEENQNPYYSSPLSQILKTSKWKIKLKVWRIILENNLLI